MSRCRKCGEKIKFKKLPSGKWKPINPDGSDHWDICTKRQWERLSDSERLAVLAKHPMKVTEGKHKEFYTGEVPPWDEGLGDFICFEGCCGQMRTILTDKDIRA